MRRAPGDHLLFAIDDTPTARYGPCVQGAGIHHNPSPGPAGEKFVYGHVWVTLAWLARHPLGTPWPCRCAPCSTSAPRTCPRWPRHYPWDVPHQAGTGRGVGPLADRLAGRAGKALWLVVDGAYAKRPFLQPVLALGVVVVQPAAQGRPPDGPAADPTSATDSAGRCRPTARSGSTWPSVPDKSAAGGGWSACSTASGWSRQIKTFEATWRPAGGRIRRGDRARGRRLAGLLLHRPATATATQVLEAMADRGAIEVAFCDAKQRLGFHDPQVWLAPAVERATPMAWLVGTLVVLWYAESGKDGVQARRRRPWYRHRPSLTFADMLASCRLQLWRHWLGQGGGLHAGREEKWAWLLEYLATAT